MNDNIKKITIKEQEEVYSILLSLHSKLSVFISLDIDIKPDLELISGIVEMSSNLKDDVSKCLILVE